MALGELALVKVDMKYPFGALLWKLSLWTQNNKEDVKMLQRKLAQTWKKQEKVHLGQGVFLDIMLPGCLGFKNEEQIPVCQELKKLK